MLVLRTGGHLPGRRQETDLDVVGTGVVARPFMSDQAKDLARMHLLARSDKRTICVSIKHNLARRRPRTKPDGHTREARPCRHHGPIPDRQERPMTEGLHVLPRSTRLNSRKTFNGKT
jgi:hypothetical protein